jgi:type VI secretion system protein ImpH
VRESPRDVLQNEPQRIPFFQAVRLLSAASRGRERVGRHADPSHEAVRFRTPTSIEFPPSEVAGLEEPARAGAPPEMTVAFMGMTGPQGALPASYTELLIERRRYRDTALWSFLDIFTHRFVSLFYRAFEKYRLPVAWEQEAFRPGVGPAARARPGGAGVGAADLDTFTEALYAFVGLSTKGLRGRLAVRDETLIFHSGLAAQRPRSAVAVEQVLASHFDMPVKVVPFIPQWMPLADDALTRMGLANSRLGMDVVCGSRIQVRQSKFRLRLGPLPLDRFEEMLPKGAGARPLVELTRFLVGMELDFEVQPLLRKRDVPACRMGGPGPPPRLGFTTWISSGTSRRDAEDVVWDAELIEREAARE